MTGLAAKFFGSAVVYAILAMTLGMVMGITQDHSQAPTHAHFVLIGWVSFALYGVFYHIVPAAAATRLATVQFWLAQISFAVMIVGLLFLFGGYTAAEPVVAAGSMGFLVSAILFAAVAFPALRTRPAA